MKKRKLAVLAAACCIGLLAIAQAGTAFAQSPTIVSGKKKEKHEAVTIVSGGAQQEQQNATGGPSGTAADEAIADSICIWGPVLSVTDGMVTIDNQSGNSYAGELVLTVSDEETLVLDAVNGFPMQTADIKVGESVYAYIGPMMTMSLPPQTPAQMILAGIPAGFKAPAYVTVESMTQGADGSWTLTAVDGAVYQVPADCMIIPYLTRNLVRLESVVKGSKLLLWSDAQNVGQKIVLFAAE